MTIQVVVQPAAEMDIMEAAFWDERRTTGLGSEFLRAVEVSVAAIRRTPDAFPRVRGDVRRILLRRFPFAIFFLADDSTVQVIACLHVRRDPGQWQRRVGPKPA